MHCPVKGLSSVGPAVLFLAFLSVAGSEPQLFNETTSVTAGHDAQAQHEKFMLNGHQEIRYVTPVGWERTSSAQKNQMMYRDGKHLIAVTLVKDIDDLSSAIDHQIRSSALRGELIHLKNQEINTTNGFVGSRCRVTSRSDGQHGDCALLGRKNVMVTISSISADGGDPLDIDQLVGSLTFTEGW
ncbi:hypothetical protein [Austwickia chelonae]|uniref:hypothetical protein n=1 Tax=Austwickia chelonae TaxID=100225 RepID=UPI000E240BC6|nr:hypothetical protein [Austwickia chelonae]